MARRSNLAAIRPQDDRSARHPSGGQHRHAARLCLARPAARAATGGPDNAAGHHVTIACGAVHVAFSHLQQHSVAVETGATLAAGDLVGRAGNSGNTTEPHLHVHTDDPETGVGVPMSFGGRTPRRNAMFPG